MLGHLDFILKQLRSLKKKSDEILFPFFFKSITPAVYEQWIVVGVRNWKQGDQMLN